MDNPFEIINDRLTKIENLLSILINRSSISDSDVWLSISELSGYLPSNPKITTIYGWVSNRKIPFHKKGKSLIFLKSDIDNWLKSERRETTREITLTANSFLKKRKK